MSQENPTWGAPRIQSELKLLGYKVADSTVAKYMIIQKKPPSQTWRAFLRNHVKQIAAIDFFTVPTVRFQILYCFIVLRHHRRRIVHFNVTRHPTARWAAQQIIEAFTYDTVPRYLIRDRDGIYGDFFQLCVNYVYNDTITKGIKESEVIASTIAEIIVGPTSGQLKANPITKEVFPDFYSLRSINPALHQGSSSPQNRPWLP
jgi:hypothetical protein